MGVYIGDNIARVAGRKGLTQVTGIALGVGGACTSVDGKVIPFEWVDFFWRAFGPPGTFESDINKDCGHFRGPSKRLIVMVGEQEELVVQVSEASKGRYIGPMC